MKPQQVEEQFGFWGGRACILFGRPQPMSLEAVQFKMRLLLAQQLDLECLLARVGAEHGDSTFGDQ